MENEKTVQELIAEILTRFEAVRDLIVMIIGKFIENRSISEIIFEDTPFNILVNILSKLIKHKLNDEKIRNKFNKRIKKRLIKISEYRNEVAHMRFYYVIRDNSLIKYYAATRKKTFDTKTLLGYKDEIDECVMDGLSLLKQITKKKILNQKVL